MLSKTTRYTLALGVAALAFIVLNLMLFVVDQTEYVVVTQFGRPIRAVTEPGLAWKLPDPIQSITRYDNRTQVYTPPQMEFLTADKKDLLIETYTLWQIDDPIVFMKAVGDVAVGEVRLSDVVSSEVGAALGKYELDELINVEADQMKLAKLTENITERCSARIRPYGARMVDLRVKSIFFPQKNLESVYSRMKAERERIAQKYRSEGMAEATKIRAEADKEKKTILAEAYQQAEGIKGEADAKAIRTYASAYGRDPKFYEFLRTLEIYDKVMDENTTLVLPTDSELMQILSKGASSR